MLNNIHILRVCAINFCEYNSLIKNGIDPTAASPCGIRYTISRSVYSTVKFFTSRLINQKSQPDKKVKNYSRVTARYGHGGGRDTYYT